MSENRTAIVTGGLQGIGLAIGAQLSREGIRIAISPGWVETELLRKSARTLAAKSGRSEAEDIAIMTASNPKNRLIQPEEIASLTACCCSYAAAGLTMEDIQVNAGALW